MPTSSAVEREYLWYGTGALLILIPLALTSTDGMLSRLGAKRWKLLHRSAYVAIVLGMIHFYQLEKADKTRPKVFLYIFGALMLYRLVRHHFDVRGELAAAKDKLTAARKQGRAKKKKIWQGELVIARDFQETPNVQTLRMVNPDAAA